MRSGRWLDDVSEQLSPTTVRDYRRLVSTMLDPDLGKLPRRRRTTQRIDAYYSSLARERGLSPASIRHVHAVLRGATGIDLPAPRPPTAVAEQPGTELEL